MKKTVILSIVAMLGMSQAWGQLQRSDEFHQKYKLSEVFVFSRHNIRASLSAPGSFISQITPFKWHDFGVNAGELTMKGGVLETINGQFFHKWVVSEGLFPENAIPTDDELYVLSNSKQRTISTARHFASSFMPMKNITVHHDGPVGNMDPNFYLGLGDDLTESDWQQIRAEYASLCTPEKLRQASESLKDAYEIMSDVLDTKNSEAFIGGTFNGFTNYNSEVELSVGVEPEVTASLNDASKAADALLFQYYEETDPAKRTFGTPLTHEQLQMICEVIHVKDKMRFASPFVQRYVSRHQREYIANALQTEGRKFTFMCGHDTNILNILSALRVKSYVTTDAIEPGTPIGSKIVFEKWTDESGNAFIGVNHVYQTLDELLDNSLLDLNTRPNIIPIGFEGMEPNTDGLYPMSEMINRLLCNDVLSSVKELSSDSKTTSESQRYTLSGVAVSENHCGITIKDGVKQLKVSN